MDEEVEKEGSLSVTHTHVSLPLSIILTNRRSLLVQDQPLRDLHARQDAAEGFGLGGNGADARGEGGELGGRQFQALDEGGVRAVSGGRF